MNEGKNVLQGPFPSVHTRSDAVLGAEQELESFLEGLRHRHELTSAELLKVLAGCTLWLTNRLVALERRVN